MKLNPFKMIDPTTQKMLLGGLVGSLSYYADLVLAEQAFYPAMLKGRVMPQLPRNDEILTSVVPPVAMYFIGKKKPKIADMAKGTILYSMPHLMQRIVVNAVKPAATAAAFRFTPSPIRVMQTTPTNSRIYPPSTPAAPTVVSAGTGKYR